ncbi:MAG TPA: hypothetical protein VLC55_08470 [Burkholderiales bacterium]|nr:hypothetical protein [Burkholderiales bacterium]
MKAVRRRSLLAACLVLALGIAPNAASAPPARLRFADFYVGETFEVGPGMRPELRLSPRITALQGQQVEILGFMDGILPRDGMYFMIIKEPTFLCPFHTTSFDWAGFAAVFLRRGTDYIDGPIRVTGRLDVGRRLDEMGLESYVRIYDAAVERVR